MIFYEDPYEEKYIPYFIKNYNERLARELGSDRVEKMKRGKVYYAYLDWGWDEPILTLLGIDENFPDG